MQCSMILGPEDGGGRRLSQIGADRRSSLPPLAGGRAAAEMRKICAQARRIAPKACDDGPCVL
ncbi:hypothetical protein MPC4_20153 [Methylocella tundrae]|uniref:Uncharacterized protein n=1 Tax=Methylocella tundrae TaxID=227605 RepID=A0A8B6M6J0_METTU|nr:hypothetical protein MPC4_20153 [Methylocella tundrae]